MHTLCEADAQTAEVIELVDFKWLMLGCGHRVDTTRLRHDARYARACLALAAGSPQPALQQAARRVGLLLQLSVV